MTFTMIPESVILLISFVSVDTNVKLKKTRAEFHKEVVEPEQMETSIADNKIDFDSRSTEMKNDKHLGMLTIPLNSVLIY